MKKILLIALLSLTCSAVGQTFPIVLSQRLPWAPASIYVGGSCSIEVVIDTVDYVYIVTSGTIAEVDSMTFPTGKITLDEATKRLTIDKSINIKNGIRVHTSSKDITINAREYASVALRSASGAKAELDHLVLCSENLALIDVKTPINAKESNIDAKGNSWIRYNLISSEQKYTSVKGNGRVVEIGKEYDRIEESAYGILFNRDHQQLPFFMEYSIGSTALGSLPFNASYVKGDNHLWSRSALSVFNYQCRYAFWATNHWSLSAGVGVHAEVFHADNTYLDLGFDSVSESYSFQAQNTSVLFAQEEAANGKTYWNSMVTGLCYITIPIRIEWRNRADYRGVRIGAELQPAVALYRTTVSLRHYGFYSDKNMVAATNNDKVGKLINPFRLDMRFSVAYGRIGIFTQSSLTPIFRTKTDNPDSKPKLNNKIFPSSFGITFTF